MGKSIKNAVTPKLPAEPNEDDEPANNIIDVVKCVEFMAMGTSFGLGLDGGVHGKLGHLIAALSVIDRDVSLAFKDGRYIFQVQNRQYEGVNVAHLIAQCYDYEIHEAAKEIELLGSHVSN